MKNCVGFDIGNHAINIAVRKGGEIVRSISERLPEGLVQNGRITSVEAMSDLLKEIRRNNKVRIKTAALVLPAGLCYCRRFTLAAMSKDQLLFNLPYEFHDFITDDKRNYFFDYAVVDIIKDDEGNPVEYDLIGAAARKDVIEDYLRMFSKAGFKLKIAVPEELAYINVLRANGSDPHRHAILDIGHNSVRLFMFLGDRFESVRVIDYGCNALDVVISEKYGVDDHYLSATYRETNYEGANELEGCREIYNAMTIEILKAVNFYRFNGGGRLEHLHCCGGGAKNQALIETLRRGLPLEVTDLKELFQKPSPQNTKTSVTENKSGDLKSESEDLQSETAPGAEETSGESEMGEDMQPEAMSGAEETSGEFETGEDMQPEAMSGAEETSGESEMGEDMQPEAMSGAEETSESENASASEEEIKDVTDSQNMPDGTSKNEMESGTNGVPGKDGKSNEIDYALIVAAAGATMQ